MNMEPIDLQQPINAQRFTLRPIQKSDAGAFELHVGDERVARMTRNIPYPMPPGFAENFIARAQESNRLEDVWILDGTDSGMGEVLGCIGLERMDRDQCEIAYWVVPGLWGTGFATEAVRAIVEANPLRSKTIFASVFQDNPASARVLTNLGFAYVGDAEYHSIARKCQVGTWTYLRKME